MELKEEYKKGGTVHHPKVGHVKIVNNPDKFKSYKKLGLDVFKPKKKKKEEA